MEQKSHKVCIVGSGNWGSAISRIIGENVRKQPELFCENVSMWVHEEIIEGKKLTEIINEQHENVKYLPNYKIPTNVVAIPDIKDAAKDSDILVFVIPHQFVARTCDMLADCVKSSAIGISLIKGFEKAEDGGIELISRIIQRKLNIPVSVLMGANIASEVAAAKFCETTIASANIEHGKLFERLVRTENFRVSVIEDTETAEMCGALKNIVACGAGFMDGLGYGDNTKAAVIRIGLMEMIKFAEVFAKNSKLTTFYESCGIADLITSCYGGRNRKVAAAFAKTRKSLKELEAEMLNGQQLQGPQTAEEVYTMLKNRNMEERFPLFTAIHRICTEELPAEKLIDYIRSHPEHM